MPELKKNRAFVRSLRFISIFLFLSYIAWILFFSQYGRYDTALAVKGSLENKIYAQGYILHDSSLVYGDDSRTAVFIAKEGERVPKNSKIATLFSEEVSDEVQIRLIRLNEKLTAKKNALSERFYFLGTSYYAEYQIMNSVKKILSVINGNDDLQKISDYKNDISKTVNQSYIGDEPNESIEQLQAQIKSVEDSVPGQKSYVFSQSSGVFSSSVDVFDEIFKAENVKNIKPDFLESLSSESQDGRTLPVAKIINNYEWYFAAAVSESAASDLRNNMNLAVRFPGVSSVSYSAVLENISAAQNGKVALVLKCDGDISSLLGKRNLQAEIIKATYSGFKVVKSALRVISGIKGVFVMSDNTALFKPVTVLGNDDMYMIVQDESKDNGSSNSNSLLLYDEIIVNSGDLYDGKVLN